MAKTSVQESGGEEIAGAVLAGIVACGVIAAESDDSVADEEKEALVEIVCAFFEGMGAEVDRAEVEQTTGELAQRISDTGAEAFIDRLGGMLTEEDHRRLGCLVAAAVTMADADVTREESATYYKIARGLGFGRTDADAIWNEAAGEDAEEGEEGEEEEEAGEDE